MANLAAALFANARLQNFTHVPALLHTDGSISYAELDNLSNRAANLLRALRVQSGDKVLLLLRDTPELVALFLGAVKAGVLPVVLSTRISRKDLGYALADSAATAVFVEPDLEGLINGSASAHSRDDIAQQLAKADATFEPLTCDDTEPAFWVCSSGSTSRPKSVVHTHGGVSAANSFHRQQLRITVGTRVLCTSKLSFAYPLSNTFLGAMDVGASVVLHPDWHDPQSLLATLERFAPEFVFSTPTLYRRVLHEASGHAQLRDVKAWVSAGEHLSASLHDEWRAITGQPILDCYGTSETLFLITATAPAAGRADSAGRPVAGVELALRDATGEPLPAGEIGELFVRHPFLACGYANNPEQTERRFKDGWFETGDLFLYDADDYWYFKGREDSRIKIAGQWVHLQDIEDAVSAEIMVKEVAAVSVADEDDLIRVALFVVAEDDCDPSQVAHKVQERLQRLPTHKRPRWLQFATALPRTNTGKIKRHELRALLHGNAGDSTAPRG